MEQHSVFSEMLTEFETMWGGHLGRMNVAKHCVEVLGDGVKLVHSTLSPATPTAEQSAASVIRLMTTERMLLEPTISKWAARIVLFI